MKKYLLISALFALSGCVSSNESVPGPSGKAIQEVKCSSSPNACFKKANAICKGPYQVMDSSSNAGGLVADIIPGPVTWYRMSVQCGKSDGKMPSFPFRGQQYTPTPIVVAPPSQPRTTTCNRFGNSVTCNSF
ncbi:hypothetical protein F7Q93_02470 [Brucella pituitosa]|uniref:Lipoprotein n=1 Tax=Brucella pituitosa TaxID=571256 RepID=A0A643F521_9HYPH|nr:hypothetical protein F7Q93_02470 [Brucella pituitosa]